MSIQGLHHITLVASHAQQTLDFYVGVLGLRFLKQTVNFDDPSSYHLYFGDETGKPGTAITFFEWGQAPKGAPGIGGTHHFALSVSNEEALLKWKRRLTDLGIPVRGVYDRHYFKAIYFQDPDGANIEIATLGPGWTVDEPLESLGQNHQTPPPALIKGGRDEDSIAMRTWPDPVPTITPDMRLNQGLHHVTAMSSDIERTHAFYSGLLGMNLVKQTNNFDMPSALHWYWGAGDNRPGTIMTYFGYRPGSARRVRMGVGQTHHVAFSVPDEETQLAFREKLLGAGFRVSPVMERVYFKSIYTSDPDGHIVELATAGPGFLVDEPDPQNLGTRLKLPPWLESYRAEIQSGLRPLTVPVWQA